MSINENQLPIIPIEESRHYSYSEENDTINLENNSNDLNSFQNFLISNASNNGSIKGGGNKSELLLKKEHRNYNLTKRKKGNIRKDPYNSGSNMLVSNIKKNNKINIKKRLLMNCGDHHINVSDLSDLKDYDNNNYSHENNNILLYDHKYREYPIRIIEKRSDKIKKFFVYSPDIIQKWIRVIFNVIITSLILILIYFIFVSVREDINKKVKIQVQNVKDESITCKKQYNAHKCGTVNLPLLNEKCDEWLKCMKTDHNLYQDISFLSAQILGQIINAFIVQFEWKSICVIAFIFILIFIGSNYALSIGGGRLNNEYNSHNNPNTTSMNSFPFYQFYPMVPNPVNYNNLNHHDISQMRFSPHNKIFYSSQYSRNPYHYQNNYQNQSENDAINQPQSHNKEFTESNNFSKKNKKCSKRLGFLKYLTKDIK